jgi:hypothetical protein
MTTDTRDISRPSTLYATSADFCRIFKEDMKHLYLLSLVLTSDPTKAEQCFVAALDDCTAGNRVFKECSRSWARRAIIKNALRLIVPGPTYANSVWNAAFASDATDRAQPEVQVDISILFGLTSFERFAFVISVFEGYSDQDCALLLGCTRQALIAARVRAGQEITRSAGIQRNRQAETSFKNQDSGIALPFPARLATPA